MAKEKDDPKDDPKEWTPDQPLPDAEDEAEVQRRHAASRRMKYLDEQAESAGKKKKSGGSERRSLFG